MLEDTKLQAEIHGTKLGQLEEEQFILELGEMISKQHTHMHSNPQNKWTIAKIY